MRGFTTTVSLTWMAFSWLFRSYACSGRLSWPGPFAVATEREYESRTDNVLLLPSWKSTRGLANRRDDGLGSASLKVVVVSCGLTASIMLWFWRSRRKRLKKYEAFLVRGPLTSACRK